MRADAYTCGLLQVAFLVPRFHGLAAVVYKVEPCWVLHFEICVSHLVRPVWLLCLPGVSWPFTVVVLFH